jgi:transcription initiation factor TFIID subunit 5
MPAAPSASGGVQRVQPATAGTTGASNATTSGPSRSQDWNSEDLQKVVLEYLTKKGFHKAETMLRLEASQMQESKDIGEGYKKITDPLFGSSAEAYELLRGFIQQSLDIYKGEMARILWPTFAYMFMDLLAEGKDSPEKLDEGMPCMRLSLW